MQQQLFIILYISFIPFFCFAQRKERTSEIGVLLGGSYYVGDLNPTGHFRSTQPAFGLIYRYSFNTRLATRLSLLHGNVQAYDSQSSYLAAQQRNLSFKSPITELSAQLEFNFLDYQIGNEYQRFSPYIFFGLGGFKFNPQAEIDDQWEELQPLGTEGQGLDGGASTKKYKLTQLSIPFGVGAKTSLSKNIGLTFEWGLRKTFTDYFDDVSTKYYNPAILAAARGITAARLSDRSIGTDPAFTNTGRQRGNSTTKDWYSFIGIILSIKLRGKAPACHTLY